MGLAVEIQTHNTTRGIGDILGTDEWRVRRLYEDGTLPEPPRFGGKRAIPRESIPAIVDALRARGWLPKPESDAEPEAKACDSEQTDDSGSMSVFRRAPAKSQQKHRRQAATTNTEGAP